MIRTREQLMDLADQVRGDLEMRERSFVGYAPGNGTRYPLVFAISTNAELGEHTGFAGAGTYVGFSHGHHSGYVFHEAPVWPYLKEKLGLELGGDVRAVTMFVALVMGSDWGTARQLAGIEGESQWL